MSFGDTDKLAEELESVLNRYGIQIRPGSDLERVCLEVKRLYDISSKCRPSSGRGPEKYSS